MGNERIRRNIVATPLFHNKSSPARDTKKYNYSMWEFQNISWFGFVLLELNLLWARLIRFFKNSLKKSRIVRKKIGKVKIVEQANIIFTSLEKVEAKGSPSRSETVKTSNFWWSSLNHFWLQWRPQEWMRLNTEGAPWRLWRQGRNCI